MAAATPAADPPAASPQAVAEATRVAMWKDDYASQGLGMQVTAIGPGTATVTMTVRRDMLNGHGTCHGGFITTVADTCFAFACNAYNELSVASGFDVNLLASAKLGDVLTARAEEASKGGRTGVYDITVTNQDGVRIAIFRGRSYTLKGKPLVPGLPMGRHPA